MTPIHRLPIGCILRVGPDVAVRHRVRETLGAPTVSEVLSLNEEELVGVPQLGPKRIRQVLGFRDRALILFERWKKSYVIAAAAHSWVRPHHLREKEYPALRKVQELLGRHPSALDLLGLDLDYLREELGWLDQPLNCLASICERLEDNMLSEQSVKGFGDSPLGYSREALTVEQGDELLAEALASKPTQEKWRQRHGVFQEYLGIGNEEATLAILGRRLGVSRERVRRLNRDYLSRFVLSIGAPVSMAFLQGGDRLGASLEEDLPKTRALFSGTTSFLRGLAFLWGVPIAELGVPANRVPAIRTSAPAGLEELARVTLPPYSREQLLAAMPEAQASPDRFLSSLQKGGVLLEVPGGFDLGTLTTSSAIARVLLDHPEGLHWKAVAALANKFLGRDPKEVGSRAIPSALASDPHFYLCGSGTYRHMKFFPPTEVAQRSFTERVMFLIREDVESLRDLHYRTGLHEICDYYFLRQCVALEADRRNDLYFRGVSGMDSVSRSPFSKSLNHSRLLLRRLADLPQPAAFREIRGHMPYLHSGILTSNLSRLNKEGLVERPQHGSWQLSADGWAHLQSSAVAPDRGPARLEGRLH